jgi:hypothetical protein
MDGEVNIGIASNQAEEWYPLFGSLLSRAQGNWELWTAFTAEDPEDSPPMARWLTLAESGALFDIEVNASPILAAEMLRRNLWNVAYGCLVTSATLTALGTFDRFRMRAGLPKKPSPPWCRARFITPTPACCACRPQGRPARCGGAHRGDHPRSAGTGRRLARRWCCSRRANRCRTCSTAWTATGASKC